MNEKQNQQHTLEHLNTAPPPRHWLNIIFLSALHVAAIGGLLAYATLHGVTLPAVLIGVIGILLTTFAISAGYHRMFAHRTFETGPVFRFLLLLLGAAAFQNSAINWAADHRRHHRHVDTPRDPYNARRGFWYSHIGWVLQNNPAGPVASPVRDLEADPLLRWQHRFYLPIATVVGLLLPLLIGALVGDLWGGLLFGGVWRLVVSYHMTFSINSLAHWLGTQHFSRRNTARDSWLTALLTMGEGYHNYHHTFPGDYRNGVRFHHFDPPKWVLWMTERIGITRAHKRTPAPVIARARLRADQQRLDQWQLSTGWRDRLTQAQQALDAKLSGWAALAKERRRKLLLGASTARLDDQLHAARKSFQHGYRDWRALLRQVEFQQSALAGA